MFGFLQDIGHTISSGVHSAETAVSNTVHGAEASVSNWLGHGADASAPVTAAGAQQHAEAAGPSGWWGKLGQGIGDFGRGLKQEGLGGLLDMGGMLDRQQAQRDLASRFQVMPDSYKGPRKSNQVSQEEFQKIAHTFSDIRRGKGDLSVDTSVFDGKDKDKDAARYKTGVMDDIANMMMTKSGRQQIENLHNNVKVDDKGNKEHSGLFGFGKSWLGPEEHRKTVITPLMGVDNGKRDKNGGVIWDDPGAGKHDWSTMRTDNGFAAPDHPELAERDAKGNRNEGSDVHIKFNPEANNIGGQGARSDIILAHEMQHTIHQTQGTMAYGDFTGSGPDSWIDPKTGVRTGYGNRERQAVGLSRTGTGVHYPGDADGCTENTYRQERNELGIGERWLPREAYAGLPGQAKDDTELNTAWDRLNKSGTRAP